MTQRAHMTTKPFPIMELPDDALDMLLSHFTDYALAALLGANKCCTRAYHKEMMRRHGSFTPGQHLAYAKMLQGHNVFLTGGAGTGKTTVLKLATDALRGVHGRRGVACAAPSGTAASHFENGETVDALFGFRPVKTGRPVAIEELPLNFGLFSERLGLGTDIKYLPVRNAHVGERLRATRVIVIDDVSLLADWTLRVVMQTLRQYSARPSSLQFIFVGDFAQLSPLGKSSCGGEFEAFAFQSPAWHELRFASIELVVNHRYSSFPAWREMLDNARNGNAVEFPTDHLRSGNEARVTIFQTGEQCRMHNASMLDAIEQPPAIFTSIEALTSRGQCPHSGIPESLVLKAGAMVRLTRSVSCDGEQLTTGTIGEVCGEDQRVLDADELPLEGRVSCARGVRVRFPQGEFSVRPSVTSYLYIHRLQTGEVAEEVGECAQLPLELAFAITVRRSQGSTFETPLDINPILSRVNPHGLHYTALSRANPDKMRVFGEVRFFVHSDVVAFHEGLRRGPLPAWW